MGKESGPERVIWINAGEASGDMHGALLVRSLRRLGGNVRTVGMGGPAMAEQGFEEEFNIRELSLMGGTEILIHLPRILGLMRRIYLRLKTLRPAAVVCIDSPDFNFFVIRMARHLGIPVYCYVCPQVWAWRTGRVKFLKKFVKRVLCILPFEKPFLAERGLDADYVGHPLMDQIPFETLRDVASEPGRIGLLPGSRTKEITSLLPEFVDAARRIREQVPEASFVLVQAPGVETRTLQSLLPDDLPVDIVTPEQRYEQMRRCQAVIAASGTVALETALLGTPTVVAYRLSALTFALAKRVISVPFISLPNLILGKQVFPELLQEDASGPVIARSILPWLTDPEAEQAARKALEQLADKVGRPGAPDRAAEIILGGLGPAPESGT